MRRVVVTSPGPRTTVEDLGRRRVARFGIPVGGAFDGLALIAANRLVGNHDDDAGLEATLGGPTLENAGDELLHVALTGADCGATIARGASVRPAPPGTALAWQPGETLRLGFARDGARCWIAIAGGIDVPPVLGSRATALAAGFGGVGGRPLRRDDVLPIGAARGAAGNAIWSEHHAATDRTDARTPRTLRVLHGPQAARFGDAGLRTLLAVPWTVQNESDRTGIRLAPPDGADLGALRGVAGIAPEGTTLGAIQVPSDGRPILLGPDRPVTGGYAKPALVIAADVGRMARLRPGDVVRLVAVTLDQALAAARERRAGLPPEAAA